MTSNTPSNPPSSRPMTLRQQLKDDIEVLLKDYLRDNLGNWHTKPTPERIEEYLRFHMPGYTREAFAKLFDIYGQEIAREAHSDRVKQNKSLCGCPMCSYHSEAFELVQAELTQKPPQPKENT